MSNAGREQLHGVDPGRADIETTHVGMTAETLVKGQQNFHIVFRREGLLQSILQEWLHFLDNFVWICEKNPFRTIIINVEIRNFFGVDVKVEESAHVIVALDKSLQMILPPFVDLASIDPLCQVVK